MAQHPVYKSSFHILFLSHKDNIFVWQVDVIQTTSEGHAKEIVETLRGTEAIIVAGGDGTLSETVTGNLIFCIYIIRGKRQFLLIILSLYIYHCTAHQAPLPSTYITFSNDHCFTYKSLSPNL